MRSRLRQRLIPEQEDYMFRILRDLVFVVPVDPTLVETKQKNEAFAIKNAKKTSSLQWKVASVGDGARYVRDGQMIHVPIPLKIGDVVILVLDDNEARAVWNSSEVNLNGERGLSVTYDSVLAKFEPDSTS
jgi:hypothetical protein